jgi:hypothetical protein
LTAREVHPLVETDWGVLSRPRDRKKSQGRGTEDSRRVRLGFPRYGDLTRFVLSAGFEEIKKPGALGVGGHGGLNFERQGESVAALLRGDFGGSAGADRVQKGEYFQLERLAGGYFGLGEA